MPPEPACEPLKADTPAAGSPERALVCHILTPEYPPQIGGIADYTRNVACALGKLGIQVHVWTFNSPSCVDTADSSGRVHRVGSPGRRQTLSDLSDALDRFEAPRWILVQWVPHGYGWQSLNFRFCFWLWRRSLRPNNRIDLMVHEPSLGFQPIRTSQLLRLARHNAVAVAHRIMTAVMLQATRRVYMAIPAWEGRLAPFRAGRRIIFSWLPIPSNIPVVSDPPRARALRTGLVGVSTFLVGHFSTHSGPVTALLEPALLRLLADNASVSCVLIGQGGEACRDRLLSENPSLHARITATGSLDASEVSLHIQACDLMLQPFLDGISTRRTGAMAALANGTPLLTTGGELSEDLWAGNRYAWACSDHSSQALAEAARQLLSDPSLRERLAEAGAALYRERFTVERVAESLAASAPGRT